MFYGFFGVAFVLIGDLFWCCVFLGGFDVGCCVLRRLCAYGVGVVALWGLRFLLLRVGFNGVCVGFSYLPRV